VEKGYRRADFITNERHGTAYFTESYRVRTLKIGSFCTDEFEKPPGKVPSSAARRLTSLARSLVPFADLGGSVVDGFRPPQLYDDTLYGLEVILRDTSVTRLSSDGSTLPALAPHLSFWFDTSLTIVGIDASSLLF
jgi:hypothetical protein